MKPAILITRTIFPEIISRLQEYFTVTTNDSDTVWSPTNLVQKLQGKAGVFIMGNDRIDETLLAACPDLRAVCSMAVGYDKVDIAACTAHGVLVSNAPDVLTETVADFGFALLLATARRVTESEHFLRRGDWTGFSYNLFNGADVHGATLGILGMGRIGQAIARRGALGFGMKVIYHNRTPLNTARILGFEATWVSKAELMQSADHLVIVTPYSAETHHVVGVAEINMMKPTATLINIARGGVVDDAALADALHHKRFAAAGLDVYEGEPHIHPALLSASNVVLTPHIASSSRPTRLAMANLAADNLIAALDKGPNAGRAPTALNPRVFATP